MGTEAGQTLETILRRTEFERTAFAWGIGNSLGETVFVLNLLSEYHLLIREVHHVAESTNCGQRKITFREQLLTKT